MRKLKYLLWASSNYFSSSKCPICSSNKTKVIDTKYLVTKLLECSNCKILFRHPVDNPNFNKIFYQEEYIEKNCLVTNLPNDEALKKMIETDFVETDRNANRIYAIIKQLYKESELNNLQMIDYGSSWGYISYQLIQKGIQVESFEISKSRAKFGNSKLSLNIKTAEDELTGEKDIFFSSHVIEHHPNPSDMIENAKNLLKDNGFFYCYCPNGSEEYLKKDKKLFHLAWGQVHPFYPSKNYFSNQFKNNPYYIGSNLNPIGIKKMLNNEQYIGDLTGSELIIISKPNIHIKDS
ncbi:MAG: class I SAM-dependent methyltransferase [Flavobacteriaceae bacterium]|nr:class I SAM-dependent methyltransferase [Flavobacteriaceae bacterium]